MTQVKALEKPIDWKVKPLSAGAFRWQGLIARYLDFTTREQLMDEAHWRRLEDQFMPRWNGGVDDDNGWKGEFWGKLMRGACLVCAASGDEALYAMLRGSVLRLLDKQDDLGRICSYTVAKEFNGWDMWGRKYVMLGMFYFIEICPEKELCDRIVAAMSRHADYILDHVGEGKKDITATTAQWGGANSCSIMEPMVRLYELTGEQRYLDFATYIVERGGSCVLNIFEAAYEKRAPYTWGDNATKAYETMSCFEGLLRYYRLTGIEKWKTALINFVEVIAEKEISLIGNAGCTHELFDNAAVHQFAPEARGIMQETCVAVTWMKLCCQTFCLTGDVRLAERIERTMFNAIIGAANTDHSSKNGGLVFDSYSPLYMDTRGQGIGGLRILDDFWINGCCVSIAAAGVGLMGSFPVMSGEDGIYVNSFCRGTVTVPVKGNDIRLTFDTCYPADGEVKLTVSAPAQTAFALRLRVPAFAAKTALAIDGTTRSCAAGEYAVIDRVWSGETEIRLYLDCDVRLITPAEFGASDIPRVALAKGPLILARDARFGENITLPVSLDNGFSAEPVRHPAFDTEVCLKITQTDGTTFTVADYSSCGKTWDARSMMSAWLPTE